MHYNKQSRNLASNLAPMILKSYSVFHQFYDVVSRELMAGFR